jgi:two-component system response regulator AtoC
MNSSPGTVKQGLPIVDGGADSAGNGDTVAPVVDADTLWRTLEAAFPTAAVFVVDGNQVVRAWSTGAEALLGMRATDVVGESCRKSNRCQTCMMGCGLRERRSIDDVPLTLYKDDGSTVNVRKTARAFPSADGRFVGGVEILVPDTAPRAAAPPLPKVGAMVVVDEHDAPVDVGGILTRDPGMKELLRRTENVAKSDVTVLVRGESGTGKELFARLVHDKSTRAKQAFLALNCAAVSPTLLESELFGHEKGAFTGAIAQHAGYFEQADGGTLFLDEVAELPLDVQAKLLRVLETKTFFRLGGKKAISVDVRLVSATHKSLRDEVSAGRFREDLLYRLRVVPIFLPPLRDRKVDVPVLVDAFLARLNQRSAARGGRVVERIAPDALRTLYAWPYFGNVRELKNIVEYAFAVGTGPVLARADLPPELLGPVPSRASDLHDEGAASSMTSSSSLSSSGSSGSGSTGKRGRPKKAIDPAERAALEDALLKSGGDVGAAAARLGVSRATFWRRRQALGVRT